MFETPLSKP